VGVASRVVLLLRACDVCVCDFEGLLVDGELDRGAGSHGAQVVHARLEPQFPACEVHACDLAHGGFLEVDVEGLGLVDEGAAVGGHLNDGALRDFPYGFIERLDVGGDVGDVLDGAAVGDNAIFHVVAPETHVDEVFEEPGVDDLEFASEHSTGVDIGSVGFEALIVAENLAGGGGRHGGDEKGVADAVFGDGLFQQGPVPEIGWCYVPHVVLEDAL